MREYEWWVGLVDGTVVAKNEYEAGMSWNCDELERLTGVEEVHIDCHTLLSYSPFYGYHASEELFLKIYLYNPGLVKR